MAAHRDRICKIALIAWAASSWSALDCAVVEEADRRAIATERQMTAGERTTLTHGIMVLPFGKPVDFPPDAIIGAGYIAGIPRLSVPSLRESDASLGIGWVMGLRKDGATALPSGLALAATWNPKIARAGGVMIAKEALAKGFNVLLAGGVNLAREPRNGRNFEYLGEDPWLAGRSMALPSKESNHSTYSPR